MFENFPYTDMHQLNLDWIVKIAKDFLDQYTHIQDLITTGIDNINSTTQEDIQSLNDRAEELETLLNEWYETHNRDIQIQLANAINAFTVEAVRLAEEAAQSIPADYTALADTVAAALIKTANMFNFASSGNVNGKIIYSASQSVIRYIDLENWSYTHPIPIEYNKYYSFTGTPNIGAQSGYVFIFDSTDTYLGFVQATGAGNKYTFQNTFANGAYARFNIENADADKIVFVEGAVYPDYYVDFGVSAATKDTLSSGGRPLNEIIKALTIAFDIAINLFNINSASNVTGKVLAYQSGSVVELANVSFGYSELMPVMPGYIYSYYGNPELGGVANRVFAYDAQGSFVNFMDGITDPTKTDVYSITINNPAIKYIRMNYKLTNTDDMFVRGKYPDIYHSYNEPIYTRQSSENILSGKKLVTAGDSYTAASFTGDYASYNGKNYGYYIAQRNNMELDIDAVNGSTMTITNPQDPDYRAPFAYQRYQQIPADTDYLTIMFGINDSAYAQLGNINDNTANTFYGAWNIVFRYFLTNYPFMKIGVIIPTTVDDERFQEAIRQVCRKWGYPYLDLAANPYIPALFDKDDMGAEAQTLRRDAFGFNGPVPGHPNPQLHEYESTVIEAFLRSI